MGLNQSKWEKAKKLVNARDGGKCLRCLAESTQVHHRMVKGMGGTSDPDRNYGMANLISLCLPCHDHVHANPAESYENGFLVHSYDTPDKCPLLLRGETLLIYLTADGNITRFMQQPLF